MRVLVAHRDPTERDYVAAALTGWGHSVVTADGSEEARARLAAGVDVALIDRDCRPEPRGMAQRFESGRAPRDVHSDVGSGGHRGGRAAVRTGRAARRAARSLQGVRMSGQRPLLVVVDDEEGILEVVGRFAQRAGYRP